MSLAAFQNLSTDEKADFARVIDDMKSAPYTPSLKLRAIAYGLLNIAGERSFHEVMEGLRQYALRADSDHPAPPVEPDAPAEPVPSVAPPAEDESPP
jgi:hypothetical protein